VISLDESPILDRSGGKAASSKITNGINLFRILITIITSGQSKLTKSGIAASPHMEGSIAFARRRGQCAPAANGSLAHTLSVSCKQHLVWSSEVQRVVMHHRAKFGEDPSNRCLDMAILLLSRWRPTAVLDF